MTKVGIKEIAWLAGLIEGEGFFQSSKGLYPVMAVKMIDEDTIRKVSKLWGRPYNSDTSNVKIGWSSQWRVNICGTPAIEWMFTIYPLMSCRRKYQMLEVINKWKKIPAKVNFKCGHPRDLDNIRYSGKSKICKICNVAYNIRKWKEHINAKETSIT